MLKTNTLIGSLLVLAALGSVYSWSLFNAPLSAKFGYEDIGAVAFTFGIMTLFLAVGSSLSGFLKLKIGMQNTVALSAVCTGAGLLISAFAPNIAVLYISAGVLLGFGDGLGYMLVLTNCVKFFPKNKGLVSALCIGAYGLGSLLFKSIDSYLIATASAETALLTWGIIISCAVTLGSIMIADAMQQSSVTASVSSSREYDLQSAIRTVPYWYLSIMFFIDCMVGLYIIGVSSNLGTALLNMSAAEAAGAVSVVALANIAGRLTMGILSDKLPRIRLITFDQTLSLIAVLMLMLMPLTPVTFFSALALIAFSFGGTLTIYPSVISDFFGIRNLAKNYGLLYLGFGIGSLLGYAVAVVFGSYNVTFTFMSVLLLVAIVLSLIVKLPAELKEGHSSLVRNNKLHNKRREKEAAEEQAKAEEAKNTEKTETADNSQEKETESEAEDAKTAESESGDKSQAQESEDKAEDSKTAETENADKSQIQESESEAEDSKTAETENADKSQAQESESEAEEAKTTEPETADNSQEKEGDGKKESVRV